MNYTHVQLHIPYTLQTFVGLLFACHQVIVFLTLGVVQFLLGSVPRVHLRLKFP